MPVYVQTSMPPFHGFVQTSEQVAIGIAVEMHAWRRNTRRLNSCPSRRQGHGHAPPWFGFPSYSFLELLSVDLPTLSRTAAGAKLLESFSIGNRACAFMKTSLGPTDLAGGGRRRMETPAKQRVRAAGRREGV